jgi:hypothetical protein
MMSRCDSIGSMIAMVYAEWCEESTGEIHGSVESSGDCSHGMANGFRGA